MRKFKCTWLMTNKGRVARRISLPRTHLPHTRHILDDPTALQSPSLSRDSPFTSLAQWLTISHKTASRDSQKRENKLPPSAVTAMHWRRQSSLRIRGRGDRAAARNNCTLKKNTRPSLETSCPSQQPGLRTGPEACSPHKLACRPQYGCAGCPLGSWPRGAEPLGGG